MLPLVQDWVHHYGEFWRAIKIRNLWFIRLRYLASLVLLGFLLISQFILHINFSNDQIVAIITIVIAILVYNLLLQSIQKYASTDPNKFNELHLSLIQMILDLTALMVLVYYTGLTESPLYMFFIFHMIIGSLVLPGYIVYFTAGVVSFTFTFLTILQRYYVIKRHFIEGLNLGIRTSTLTHDVLFVIIFTLMLFISVYIANKIAHQLYKREQQLRSSLEKLNEAETSKQKYTIGVVHEIKTPISAVHSILELIRKGFVGEISPAIKEKIDRAKLRSEEAIELINDILRISKLKLLEIRLNDEINILEFINKTIDNFSESAKEKSIEINVNEGFVQHKTITSDKILLELIFSNLIGNAIKYAVENGKVEIKVSEINDKLFIEISDNGIGIPQNELDKIFNQFFRASNIDKTMHEGTGMGLTIVKEIVEKLGGAIKVISPSKLAEKERPGTSFEISLPFNYKPLGYDIFAVNDDEYLKNKSDF